MLVIHDGYLNTIRQPPLQLIEIKRPQKLHFIRCQPQCCVPAIEDLACGEVWGGHCIDIIEALV